MAAGITIWLTAQMMINVGMVLGLLPVIGIPLPLVSYGGSALLPTLVALGLLISFARAEPGAKAALRAHAAGAGVARPGSPPARARVVHAMQGAARRRRHRRPHLPAAGDRRRAAPARPGDRDHCARHRRAGSRPASCPRPATRSS